MLFHSTAQAATSVNNGVHLTGRKAKPVFVTLIAQKRAVTPLFCSRASRTEFNLYNTLRKTEVSPAAFFEHERRLTEIVNVRVDRQRMIVIHRASEKQPEGYCCLMMRRPRKFPSAAATV